MSTEVTGSIESFLGLTAVWGIVLTGLALWATLIYFLNYFNVRAIRREVEAMKDAMEVQVHLTEKLIAALAAPPAPPTRKDQGGS
jgi:hypothetical protein